MVNPITDAELAKMEEEISWRDGGSCYTYSGELLEALILRLRKAEKDSRKSRRNRPVVSR